jgi:acyl carrier protein
MDDKIKRVFYTVFQISSEQVSDSLSPEGVPGWDSLGHVRLVTALQEEFGVEFEVDDIMRMENVGEIKSILAGLQPK